MIHKNKDHVRSLSCLYQYTHLSTLTVTYADIAARQFHFAFPNCTRSDLPKELAFNVTSCSNGYGFKEKDVTSLCRILMCSAYLLGIFALHFLLVMEDVSCPDVVC